MPYNWLNLKDNRCPICSDNIIRSEKSDYDCFNCRFFCRYKKAKEIIASVEYNTEQKEHDKIVDDFIANNK